MRVHLSPIVINVQKAGKFTHPNADRVCIENHYRAKSPLRMFCIGINVFPCIDTQKRLGTILEWFKRISLCFAKSLVFVNCFCFVYNFQLFRDGENAEIADAPMSPLCFFFDCFVQIRRHLDIQLLHVLLNPFIVGLDFPFVRSSFVLTLSWHWYHPLKGIIPCYHDFCKNKRPHGECQ